VTDATGGFDLDLAVSSIAADGGDNQIMMRVLMERLESVLGDRVRIEREGRIRKTNVIRRVEIRLQDAELVAELAGSSPTFTIGRVSGGIRIRSEQTDAAGWIRILLEALRREADHNALTRQTLESLVIGRA
jgi:hypothetical protein